MTLMPRSDKAESPKSLQNVFRETTLLLLRPFARGGGPRWTLWDIFSRGITRYTGIFSS